MFSVGVSASADSAGSMLPNVAPAPSPADPLRNFRREKPSEPFPLIVILAPSCLLRLSHRRIPAPENPRDVPEHILMALERTHQPAIDDKQLAGHIPAILGCEKDHRTRDIFGITGPAQRYLALVHIQVDEFGGLGFIDPAHD